MPPSDAEPKPSVPPSQSARKGPSKIATPASSGNRDHIKQGGSSGMKAAAIEMPKLAPKSSLPPAKSVPEIYIELCVALSAKETSLATRLLANAFKDLSEILSSESLAINDDGLTQFSRVIIKAFRYVDGSASATSEDAEPPLELLDLKRKLQRAAFRLLPKLPNCLASRLSERPVLLDYVRAVVRECRTQQGISVVSPSWKALAQSGAALCSLMKELLEHELDIVRETEAMSDIESPATSLDNVTVAARQPRNNTIDGQQAGDESKQGTSSYICQGEGRVLLDLLDEAERQFQGVSLTRVVSLNTGVSPAAAAPLSGTATRTVTLPTLVS